MNRVNEKLILKTLLSMRRSTRRGNMAHSDRSIWKRIFLWSIRDSNCSTREYLQTFARLFINEEMKEASLRRNSLEMNIQTISRGKLTWSIIKLAENKKEKKEKLLTAKC